MAGERSGTTGIRMVWEIFSAERIMARKSKREREKERQCRAQRTARDNRRHNFPAFRVLAFAPNGEIFLECSRHFRHDRANVAEIARGTSKFGGQSARIRPVAICRAFKAYLDRNIEAFEYEIIAIVDFIRARLSPYVQYVAARWCFSHELRSALRDEARVPKNKRSPILP